MTEASPPSMTSHRPYLLRALYTWIADNDMTPHLLVDAERSGVQVPAFAVKEGKIVLNVAQRAVSSLDMGNEVISFTARFGGVSHPVRVPIGAVLAIYARETGQGMALPEDMAGAGVEHSPVRGGDALEASDESETSEDGGDDRVPPTPRRSGHLRVVK